MRIKDRDDGPAVMSCQQMRTAGDGSQSGSRTETLPASRQGGGQTHRAGSDNTKPAEATSAGAAHENSDTASSEDRIPMDSLQTDGEAGLIDLLRAWSRRGRT